MLDLSILFATHFPNRVPFGPVDPGPMGTGPSVFVCLGLCPTRTRFWRFRPFELGPGLRARPDGSGPYTTLHEIYLSLFWDRVSGPWSRSIKLNKKFFLGRSQVWGPGPQARTTVVDTSEVQINCMQVKTKPRSFEKVNI